ncbi:MAG: succinate dehydrogenase iron-sulfur subunit [Pseudonocardiaceae bacterium]
MPEDPDDVTLRVTRYRPEQENEPTTHSYQVPLGDGWTVLDGLNHIKDQMDGTLSYRSSCRMGICGSCGMTVNGEPRLACATLLADYALEPVLIEPLNNFPVIRDLVVDIDDVMRKLVTVKPWIVRDDDQPVEAGEYLQTPAELDEYQQYSMCINCMLCYSVCPSYALDPVFLGPATIAIAQRYNLDSRDQGGLERMDALSASDGVWGCTAVGECTSVCPKGVDPAGAIQRYKLTAATESLKTLLWRRGAR